MNTIQAYSPYSYTSAYQSCGCSSTANNIGSQNDMKLYSALSERYSVQAQNNVMRATYEKDSAAFTKEINSIMKDLQSSASSLKQFGSDNVFEKREYESENKAVATVLVDKVASNDNTSVDLEVSQIAQGKQYQTKEISSDGIWEGAPGGLNIVGEASLEFNFTSGITNKEALDSMADTVNKAGYGVTASVVQKDGNSFLEISSNETGLPSDFEVAFTGDAGAKLDINVSQKAQNLKYSVNGVAQEDSAVNQVVLKDKTLEVVINSAGKTTFTRESQGDYNGKIYDAVEDLAEKYNKAVDFLKDNSSKSSGIRNLSNSFDLTRFSSSALSGIGIQVDMDGRLTVNEANFQAELGENPEKVKKMISSVGGLADEVYTRAKASQQNAKDLYPKPDYLSTSSSAITYNRFSQFVPGDTCGMFFSTVY